MGYFLGYFSSPLIYVSVFVPIPYCLDYYSFVIWFEIRKNDVSGFVLLSLDYFGYLGYFHTNFRIFYLCEKCQASLVVQWVRICLLMQGTRVQALVWEDPTCCRAARPMSHNY